METNTLNRTKEKRARRSREEIKRIVALFERSGQTHEAFCKEHGFGVSTFYSWRRKVGLDAASVPAGFKEVRLSGVPSSGTGCAGAAIRFPDGTEVRLDPDTGVDAICRILLLLRGNAQ